MNRSIDKRMDRAGIDDVMQATVLFVMMTLAPSIVPAVIDFFIKAMIL